MPRLSTLPARADAPANTGCPRALAEPTLGGVSRRRLVLVILSTQLALLLSALDQTIVGTAAPRILADLNGFQHYA
jgi:hypothetical protein